MLFGRPFFAFARIASLCLVAGLSAGLVGCPVAVAQRNPPPVFETDYTLPITETPTPSFHAAENFINVGLSLSVVLYALFLLIAGLAVHRWRSRKIIFCLAVCSVIILGFILQGCPCPVGMFQNLVHVFFEPAVVISWTILLLFLMPLFAALFWGRIFCSAVCPLGAFQELAAVKNLKIPDRLEHVLGLFRYVWLGIGVFCTSVGLGYIVCQYDPFLAFFQMSGLYHILLFGGGVLIACFFIGRPFCRFLCPYGALLGICGSLASKKVSITPGQCDLCKLCEHVCPNNAILAPTNKPTPLEKRRGPINLAIAILALPILILVFAQVGSAIAPRLAPLHQDIRTARLLYLEEESWVTISGTFPETRGLAQTGTPSEYIYRRAVEVYRMFGQAGFILGAWVGFVIGVKWIVLSLRHRRLEYEVDPARCFACGRCFWYCPNQKEQRLLLIGDPPPG